MRQGADITRTDDGVLGDEVLRIDGRQPISADLVARVGQACDRAEALGGSARVIVHLLGVPEGTWTDGLNVALVNRWERGLRRLERLPATTVAVADGDCGGVALDILLATDYRVATTTTRLIVPVGSGATWPGMALYRLASHGSARSAVRRAVLFGAPIDALSALALQLVDEVTDEVGEALDRAAGLTGAFAGPELAIRRQLMLDAGTTSFEEALGAHLAACDRALRQISAGAAS
ncbi:enoyl-CoA-hydratase DpgB [Frankia sp. Cas3]|uniref:enoyl-CoA-hydratase DpgB n=1 Tax=Frankia sp. Cas3 TaxID=3073926 RepID=UPI002AD32138|nr:enoyl-CoA-hydratase DpgB [Frankia sp. Cas3]